MTEMAASAAGSASGGDGYTIKEEGLIVEKIEEFVVLNNHVIPAVVVDKKPEDKSMWGYIGGLIQTAHDTVTSGIVDVGTAFGQFIHLMGQGAAWDPSTEENLENLRPSLNQIVKQGIQLANSRAYELFVVLPKGKIRVEAKDSVILVPYNQRDVYNLLLLIPTSANASEANFIDFDVVKQKNDEVPGITVHGSTWKYAALHYRADMTQMKYNSVSRNDNLRGVETTYGGASGEPISVPMGKSSPPRGKPSGHDHDEDGRGSSWGQTGTSSALTDVLARARPIAQTGMAAAYMPWSPMYNTSQRENRTVSVEVTPGMNRSVYSLRALVPPSKDLGTRVQKVINVLEKFRGQPFNEENKKTVAQLAPTMLPGLDGKQAMGGDLKTQVTRFITALNRMMKWKLTARDADALITGLTQLVEKYGN